MHRKVTKKGLVVIPKDLRIEFGIHKGTRIHFAVEGGRIFLTPITEKLIDRNWGILKRKKNSLTKALLEERRKDRIREDKKTKRWIHP